VRERVRISLGGPQIRLQFSNQYGNSPLLLGSVSVGIARSHTEVAASSLRKVTFDGNGTVTIPPGADFLSDPVSLSVPNGSELAISLYVPGQVKSITWHALALKNSVITPKGDHTRDVVVKSEKTSNSVLFLSRVLVSGPVESKVVVAFGDSIVDGDKSTPEADRTWPADLFRRLQQTHDKRSFAVLNEGVAGNRLLSDGPFKSLGISGVARFGRDALGAPGVSEIIMLEGANDIGFPGARLGDLLLASIADAPTADDIIAGYKKLIQLSHARGIRIIGCTIMPTEGADITGYHTDEKERIRQSVNDWIRTREAFNGVIDFDAVMRDPEHPSRLSPALASKDHLHPNDIGYQRMADAIDLAILK
jgi:lysophospholipase L1-like esterase